jgi:hypothetical protein
MKKRAIIFFGGVLLFLQSCTSVYKSGYVATPTTSLNTEFSVRSEVIVDTTKTLQGYSETIITLGFLKTSDVKFIDAFGKGTGEREKMAAVYKALENTTYDVLVNPKYIVTVNDNLFVKKISVVVAGYGGKIKLK